MIGYQVIFIYTSKMITHYIYLYPTEKLTKAQKELLKERAFGDHIVYNQQMIDYCTNGGINCDNYIRQEDCILIEIDKGNYDLSSYKVDNLWIQKWG